MVKKDKLKSALNKSSFGVIYNLSKAMITQKASKKE
jgi:hypothetical protein